MKTPITSIEDLAARHRAIYEEFRPTLNNYTRMASELLSVQEELFRRRLAEAFPGVTTFSAPLAITVSARGTVASFDAAVKALAEKKITPAMIIYDPIRHDFCIFGKPPEEVE